MRKERVRVSEVRVRVRVGKERREKRKVLVPATTWMNPEDIIFCPQEVTCGDTVLIPIVINPESERQVLSAPAGRMVSV